MDIKEKGIQGEAIVRAIIEEELEEKACWLNDCYYEYPSALSGDGYMTAQIDHLVDFDNIIACIETKNYQNLDTHGINENKWCLRNGDKVDNPVIQNHRHKEILCSLFNITPEEIITIEVVIGLNRIGKNGYARTKRYENDFIANESGLRFLLDALSKVQRNCICDRDQLWNRLEEENLNNGLDDHSKHKLEERHIRKIAYAKSVHSFFHHQKNINLHYNNTAQCSECGAYLCFKKFQSKKEGNIKNSKDYLLGCVNYRKDGTGCVAKPIYNPSINMFTQHSLPRESQVNIPLEDSFAGNESKKSENSYQSHKL